jgi:hypothetical protein
MSDISDDEQIQKPKRVMSDKQKEALAKGRALAKANREASKTPVETKVEEPKNEVKAKRAKKVVEVVRQPSPEPQIEIPKGKRVSRRAKEVREPSPQPVREPSPEIVKKTRQPRKKKTEAPSEPTVVAPKPIRQRPSLQFV